MQEEVEDLFQSCAVNSEKDGIRTQAAKFCNTVTQNMALPFPYNYSL